MIFSAFKPLETPFLRYSSWILRITAAVILTQSLSYKFGAHPDSIELFSQLGVEPTGRIALGIIELLVSLLLIIPRTQVLGSIGGMGIMTGAIFIHIFIIGIVFREDGGGLFALALGCFLACALNFLFYSKQLSSLIKLKYGK
ncbi:MAG: DoxX family protein [Algoriphagus sp.]|nr:DoxX family protein [Algoriphagus sp.]